MVKKAVIICNGSVNTKHLYSHISKGDFIVCADGGANKLIKTKFEPDLIIGDMDSISKNALKKFKGVELIKFPREKDKVDLELALDYCIENKFREINIMGALGSRADMTLTNVFILTQIPKNIEAKIIHENQEIYLVPKKLSIKGVPHEAISLFPLKGDVKGLTLKGFKYELENYTLRFGIGIGISNEFKKKKVSITFKDGTLLCVHFRKWF
ncbi:MAG: thiamine diphosphokinase [Candidatus Diapherotrites archaeon]|uniref:Thiamine diphosphokinase n=1 Tax=Candidatus Iainarchaeum sp. TaxID=3101447 RepID=A0A2D6LPC1_9ARCH|nr:thiamine diphosphokinase [Candidatus Diapherotrites archaeon]|tara:strand:- start:6360 stop:6995 length:636 start_codon:yes stop_codon:yes gene_type:complete